MVLPRRITPGFLGLPPAVKEGVVPSWCIKIMVLPRRITPGFLGLPPAVKEGVVPSRAS